MKKNILLSLVIFLFSSSYVFAGTDGTVRGKITDINGEPLPGAQIYIPELGIGAMADVDGNYILLNVQVGTYDIKCSMIGYADRITNSSVLMNQTLWLNLRMKSNSVKRKIPTPKKSSSLVTTVPESGSIEGFVIASCGICNFDYKKKRGCSLTIKIGDTVYPVKGTSIKNHGNAHSKEGMCNVVRIAYASGTLKENVFYSDSFSLIESPK